MKIDIVEYFKKIDFRYKITFFSCIVFGFLSQGTGMFNKLSYQDDIGALFTLGATTSSGRWMLEVIYRLEKFIFGDGTYSMPVINGTMSILYIGVAACLIVSLLDIKNNFLCICLGGIMVVYPTITGLFGYLFTAPSYMFAMLMGIAGTFLICKNQNYKIIFGIIMIACSIGVYQAFIPLYIGIFVIYLIKCVINNSNETEKVIKEAIKSIVVLLLSAIVYFVVNKLVITFNNIELTSYQGIDTMGKISIAEYLSRMVYAYGRFFILNSKSKYYMYYGNIIYVYYLILVIILILMISNIIKIYKANKLNAIILFVLFICIPLASNFIFVMVDSGYVHSLMVYGQIIPFILLLLLLDNIDINGSFIKAIYLIGTILLLIINIMYCRLDNQCYLKATFAQQESISYFTTLITRIKSCENYDDDLPVSFIFINGEHIEDKSMYNMNDLDYIRIIPYENQYGYVNSYNWQTYMSRWCGYSPEIVDGQDLYTNKEVLEMSCYPDAGSIKVVEGRVVVRFQ